MGYKNGKYYCDKFGAVRSGMNSKGWNVSKGIKYE